ncbi:unnamed protein product [Zymoseptoria tritici ST99CH_1E4]|uniref:PXA domain-containing protein n=1 Tax=Zymoseptoria tritici ST99CH_1E4 TaxID=1276532 RepID=A0A2H1GJS8_ZYMTR|nr:unnamed protein product [Zymoseptoria tritici ST99CH_1E4]
MDDTTSDAALPDAAASSTPVAIDEPSTGEPAIKSENNLQAGSTQHTSPGPTLQSIADKALDFLSHASNETLGACLVGLGASTYLVLGRVGLVIIGVAGGVVLHATWEGIRGDNRDVQVKKVEQDRRREVGVEVARRVLEWRDGSKTEESAAAEKVYANQALDYSGFGPETSVALERFTDAVIKDYVHYWYDATIPGEQSFPAASRRTFTAFVLSLSSHLGRKRPADTFLDFSANASSIIIVLLNELSVALNASPNSPAEEAILTYLEMKPDCSLSYILDEEAQKRKLRESSEEILQAYLDPKSYNCPPVHAFLKEVFAQLILGSTVTLCSRPEWINEWIVYALEESETAKEVMDIVDAGVEGRTSSPKAEANGTQHEKAESGQITTHGGPESVAHKRKVSRAEEAMDEAMREAQRLTQMMIEEDRRRALEESSSRELPSVAESASEIATPGVPTPTSSQSDLNQHSEVTSVVESPIEAEQKSAEPGSQFTSFDQLGSSQQATAHADASERARPQLTLLDANISIFDDSVPGERGTIKSKPTGDYLVQIEPANSFFPGWMIARKYADFETLHEVIRRISVITGVRFTETHAELPKWKSTTKASLRTDLERYLNDAVKYQPLSESEGMKRFLEKDRGLTKSPGGAVKGFGWPTPDAFGKLGGDMMNVLTKAPKQVAGGGKAVFGGVAGLVGAAGKRPSQSHSSPSRNSTVASNEESMSSRHKSKPSAFQQPMMTDSYLGSLGDDRESTESLREPSLPPRPRRESGSTIASMDARHKASPSVSRPGSIISQREPPRSVEASPRVSTTQLPSADARLEETINLPPPPSEMPPDYAFPATPGRNSIETSRSSVADPRMSQSIELDRSSTSAEQGSGNATAKSETMQKKPLSDRETSVAVELMFAVISELYTLSGAWQIRRTLLTAAKTFLLRPGNPQLASIKELIQSSLLDANFSDAGVAHHIYKMRENGLPTAEELEIRNRDYPEKTPEQKEELRIKARRLLVTKGMPQALTSVMGAAASGEALGKVFDCLQVPGVSRGLIFGLMLQALRVITD